MTDSNSKSATYRLFKVAAELNIGKDAIVEFLRTKGHEVADKPTTALTQEMYDIVMGKFEREHKQIEKQRKKVDAYHEKSAKIKEDLITKPVPTPTGKTTKAQEVYTTENKLEQTSETIGYAATNGPQTDIVADADLAAPKQAVEHININTEPEKELPNASPPITDHHSTEEQEVIVSKENIITEIEPAETISKNTIKTEVEAQPVESTKIVEDKPNRVNTQSDENITAKDETKSSENDILKQLPEDKILTGVTKNIVIIPELEVVKDEKIYIKKEIDAEEVLKKYDIPEIVGAVDDTLDPHSKKDKQHKKDKLIKIDDEDDATEKGKKKKKRNKEEGKAEVEEYETSDGKKLLAPPPKLQGLTVLGKIEIAKNDDSKGLRGDKKKRKRIKGAKVDIEREAKNQSQVASKDRKDKFGREAKVYSREVKPTDKKEGTDGKTFIRPNNQGGQQNNQNRPQGGGFAGNRFNRAGGTSGFAGSTSNNSGNNNAGGANNKKRKRGVAVNQDDVQRAIRQTRAAMDDVAGSQRQKRSKQKRDAREEKAIRTAEDNAQSANILKVTEFITVAELAALMNVQVGQVIGKCIGLGLMVSINQRLDTDTIQLVADEFGYVVEFITEYEEKTLDDVEDEVETLKPRAPIVTIMGHVDHGKTSLLDYIRSANVVAGEAGGITQHIGAYSVQIPDGRKITFLDTPGHEAFTAMRARGAQVTDIVVLVVAADDSVMPQTVEAISHAQAAGVPMVIAVNKIDKPEANLERIKQQLSDRGVLIEEWGGKYGFVPVSAKKGIGINDLLDRILLEAELLDLKANPDRNARGVVVEAELDRGKGIIANVLVQKGTLKIGDSFVVGQYSGKIRALLDERGKRVNSVGPSEPTQILGIDGIPAAGDTLVVLDSEQEARDIAGRRQQLKREQEFKQRRHITLDQISAQIAKGGVQNLRLIIKGDVDGSVEAVADSLQRLSNAEVQVSVVLKSVGEISESDVLLATASDAIIIGFHVRPNLKARKLAEQEGVDIRIYQIIYEAVNEVKAAIEGMLKPIEKEEITATIEVRDIFKISKIGTIAGCYVADGKINRNDKVRLVRDGFEVFNGSIDSLKRHKDDVKEVDTGFECGISLQSFNDIRVGDVIEAYKIVEIKRKLESAAALE